MAEPVPKNIEMQIYQAENTNPNLDKDDKFYHSSPKNDFMYTKDGVMIHRDTHISQRKSPQSSRQGSQKGHPQPANSQSIRRSPFRQSSSRSRLKEGEDHLPHFQTGRSTDRLSPSSV